MQGKYLVEAVESSPSIFVVLITKQDLTMAYLVLDRTHKR